MNSTLKKELVSLWAKLPEGTPWDARRMAIAVVRTVLVELGCKEVLGDDQKESRFEVVKAIESCFTAPINYRRNQMVAAGICPKMTTSEKAEVGESDC